MRELQFADLHLFARVADLGSLSAAARERDVPVSQVSRTLARIEKLCGARLVHRSTHGLSLTPEGESFLAYCRRGIATLDEMEGEFASRTGGVSGLVRVSASSVVAHYVLLPTLPLLHERHPQLRLELDVGDRFVDMAREGIDIAIRTIPQLPDTVVARQVGTLGRALYASPGYAKAHGLPAHPDQLHAHDLVANSAVPVLNQWPFQLRGKRTVFVAEGRWRSNDTGTTAAMVLQGLGIGRLATSVGDLLQREGRLVPVLEQFVDRAPVPVYAVTLSGRHRLPKIRACIEHWAASFGQAAPPGALAA